MRESTETIRQWMKEKKAKGDDYMLVACDTFDYEQYPIGVKAAEFWTQYDMHSGKNMQRIEGVYDLAKMEATQEYPPKPVPPMTEREALEEVRKVLLDPENEHVASRANKALDIIDKVLGKQK